MVNETGKLRCSIEARTIRKLRSGFSSVFLLFVVAILDRVNIGFAALTMTESWRSPAAVRIDLRDFLSATLL